MPLYIFANNSGFSGTSGTSGFSGFSGTSGLGGTSGTSGFSGISGPGISGASGTSGFSGTSGGAGTSGISGTSGFSGFKTKGTVTSIYKVKSDDQLNNTDVYNPVSGLSFSVLNGETWIFLFRTIFTNGNSVTPDIRFWTSGYSGWTGRAFLYGINLALTSRCAVTTDVDEAPGELLNPTISADGGATITQSIQGIVTATSDGTFQLGFAEKTGMSGHDLIIKAGSFVIAQKSTGTQ